MRKIAFLLLTLALPAFTGALEKQPLAVYHARRQALAEKTGAAVLMFAAADATSGRLNWAKLRGTGVSDITGARSSRLTTCARCA